MKERSSKKNHPKAIKKITWLLMTLNIEKVTNLVKLILLESNVLQCCVNENPLISILNEKSFQPSSKNLETLANKLKMKETLITLEKNRTLCTLCTEVDYFYYLSTSFRGLLPTSSGAIK